MNKESRYNTNNILTLNHFSNELSILTIHSNDCDVDNIPSEYKRTTKSQIQFYAWLHG